MGAVTEIWPSELGLKSVSGGLERLSWQKEQSKCGDTEREGAWSDVSNIVASLGQLTCGARQGDKSRVEPAFSHICLRTCR